MYLYYEGWYRKEGPFFGLEAYFFHRKDCDKVWMLPRSNARFRQRLERSFWLRKRVYKGSGGRYSEILFERINVLQWFDRKQKWVAPEGALSGTDAFSGAQDCARGALCSAE